MKVAILGISFAVCTAMPAFAASAADQAQAAPRNPVTKALGDCGDRDQRSCTIFERKEPCDEGLKLTALIGGKCVADRAEPADKRRKYVGARADSISDVELLDFSIAAYSLPHHDERDLGGGVAPPKMIGCNRTDRAKPCTEIAQWTSPAIDTDLGQLEYVFTAPNGMQAGLYHYKQTNQFVLAFAGTDFGKSADIVEDVRLALQIPADRNMYRTLVRQVQARMRALYPAARMDRHLSVTGHSLGGHQAQIFAAAAKVARLTTFSAPGAEGSIRTTFPERATDPRRGRHLVREGDAIPDFGGAHYGRKIVYQATPYAQGPDNSPLRGNLGPIKIGENLARKGSYRYKWQEAQHSKSGFRKFLAGGATPYGRINFTNKRLRVDKKGLKLLRYCVAGNIDPRKLRFRVDTCLRGVTFNFDREGFFRNRRINDAFQTCMQAGRKGEQVRMAQCNGSERQRWFHKNNQFKNRATGKCLAWSQADKSQLITWDCQNNDIQRWRFF